MLREAIELQNGAVEKLLALVETKDEITFKSPTGTGKTHMMADFMNRVLEKDSNVIFLVSSLSKGELAKQNEEKFKEYMAEGKFPYLKPFLISSDGSNEGGLHIDVDYNVYIIPTDLYKTNGKLMRGPMINFLNAITSKHRISGLGKKVYFIKDESHRATRNLDSLSEYFSKVINITATPNLKRGQIPDVEIKEQDAINAKLIKEVVWGNEDDELRDALRKFKQIKKEYFDRIGMKPCIIVQISNKDKAEQEWTEVIRPTLNSSEFNDLKWMYIVDNSDNKCDTNDRLKLGPVSRWKDEAKKDGSTIDVVIFKTVISEGWDIPRACMLYQIRDVKSDTLNEQVIGRVRRNPKLKEFENLDAETQKLVTQAYVWGKKPKTSNIPVKVKTSSQDSLNMMITRIKVSEHKSTSKAYLSPKVIVGSRQLPEHHGTIFDLYDKFKRMDIEAQEACYSDMDSYSDWGRYAFFSSEIQEGFKEYASNYKESMELVKDDAEKVKFVSFPLISAYEDNPYHLEVNNWVWCRNDDSENYEDEFSFDSEAERGFAKKIRDIVRDNKEFVWGKNFLPNSEIKFEYYWDGVHSSYPDFVLKDKSGQIHIFEVKSVNKSSSIQIDDEKYREKIRKLTDAYKEASNLTGYIFYLSVLEGSYWTITKLEKGEETRMTMDDIVMALKA